MNTVVAINLNGNAYHVDENGYDALKEYLSRAEIQLKDNPDRAEIVADLEQAIADKCRRYLGPHKTVVTEAEVKQIVTEMGPVDGAAGQSGEEQARREETDDKGDPDPPKRLYLIHEGSMLAGVCEGIGAYLHIDATIVRILFIILTIVSHGLFAILYVLLAMVIPSADTPEKRAAAQGKRFSAQNVIDEAKKTYQGFRNDKKWKKHWRHQKMQWNRLWRTGQWTSSEGKTARFPNQILGVFMFPVFMWLGIALSLAAIVSVFAFLRIGPVTGFPFRMGFPELVVVLIVIGMITAPIRLARRGSYYTAFQTSPSTAVWMGVLALFCVVAGGMFLYLMVPQVHYIVDHLQDIVGGIFDR